MNLKTLTFVLISLLLSHSACVLQNEKESNVTVENSSSLIGNSNNTISSVEIKQDDSLIFIRNTYVLAIEDFINIIQKNNKITFKNLYFIKRKFNQPDDFPDIDLPEQINSTKISLLSDSASNSSSYKNLYNKNSPCINLIGWVEKDFAEFIFVTFYPGFNHQFDLKINYKFNSTKKEFEIEKFKIDSLFVTKH